PIETFLIYPYKIKAIPGGIIGVIKEVAAVNVAENDLVYPFFSISGTNILDCIAASAILDPESPPISVLNMIFTCANVPGRRFATTCANLSILEVIPV